MDTMPGCLAKKTAAFILAGSIALIISVATLIATKNFQNAIFLTIPLYFYFQAGIISWKWKRNEIIEVAAVCISVSKDKYGTLSNTQDITFSTSIPNMPILHIIISKGKPQYIPSMAYVLYFYRNNYSQIIAHEVVS